MAIAFMHNCRHGTAVVVHHHHYATEVIDPTCTEDGYTEFTCRCGDSYKDEYTDALGHEYGEEWHTDEIGHWHICSRCGEKSEVIAHTPGDPATEDTPQICTECGYVITPATGHIHSYSEWIKFPTCTEDGYTEYTCKCGDTYKVERPALGHKMTSTVLKAPTCRLNGEKYYWCENGCGYSYTHPIPMIPHNKVTVNAVPATCGNPGHTEGTKCSMCGTFLKEPESIDPLGHIWLVTPIGEQRCKRCGVSYLAHE